ncbi:hypothetical protein SEA_TORTELLINI_23 [Mycobacterium phage Tortellini]|uniref:Uncharacterized protein n=1 Tax=Mycobacterium phage Tortellini TaxID=1897497 RepID=A0A1D8EX24_9CAUD|nr:hypothetical protein FDH05_gp23 [Mycobacterium phage Tortellini]AOT25768.1 hypothetical protein SEA_TORTELLINI_23 [Mycobacterium phage Tortellini]
MRYGVAFPTAYSEFGGTNEVIEFGSEHTAQAFIDTVQPVVGVVLTLVRFDYSTYETIG